MKFLFEEERGLVSIFIRREQDLMPVFCLKGEGSRANFWGLMLIFYLKEGRVFKMEPFYRESICAYVNSPFPQGKIPNGIK